MVAAVRLDRLAMSNFGFRFALVLVTLPAPVLAEPAVTSPTGTAASQVSLHYLGDPGCPEETEFVYEVTARVRRTVQWSKAGAAVQMVVIIRQVGDHASGTLEVVQRGTEPTRREFTAASCAEVGSALALVAALALDPNARTEQLPVHALSAAPSTEPSPAPLLPPPSQPLPLPSPPPAPSPAPPAPPVPPPSPRDRYLVWLGPTAMAAAGYAAEPLVAVGLSLGARSVRPGFSPGFQLTPLWGKTGTTGPDASGGTFAWAMGRLEGCPLRVALAPPLSFEPCVAAELGAVSAGGASQGIVPVIVDRWWLAAGATWSLHLGLGSWFVRLGGSAMFPLTRDEFVFHDPDRSIHQASPVVVGGTLGLGFQFGS
jgi:hypothetical protein